MPNIGDIRIMAEWVDFLPMDADLHPNWLAADYVDSGPYKTIREAARTAIRNDVFEEGRVYVQEYREDGNWYIIESYKAEDMKNGSH